MKGKIYMIPCPISDEREVWDVLPKANLEVMNSLDYFIVENVLLCLFKCFAEGAT